jgi:hypothetical protein
LKSGNDGLDTTTIRGTTTAKLAIENHDGAQVKPWTGVGIKPTFRRWFDAFTRRRVSWGRCVGTEREDRRHKR